MKKSRGKLKLVFPASLPPLFYFPLWALALALLTYGPEDIQFKLWVFLAGLILPAWLYFHTSKIEKSGASIPFPMGLGVGLAGLALFLRFWKLTSFSIWPNGDEGVTGALFVHLNSHWDWKFFHLFGQAPALLYWFGALILRWSHSPFLSLWLGPALLSALLLPCFYLFLRAFWDETTAWIGTGLAAFSYWPLMIGRIFCPGDLLPIWECLLLALLGRVLKKPSARGVLLLGIAAGAGFVTFTPWISVAAWVSLFAGLSFFTRSRHSLFRDFALYFCGLALAAIPWMVLVFRENFGLHIMNLWTHAHAGGFFPLLLTALNYLGIIFTGVSVQGAAYIPVQGGFLNSLLGAFFIAGVLGLLKSREWIALGFLAGLFITFLPGMLSGGLETFRIIGLLPPLLAAAALGIRNFLLLLPASRRLWVLTAVLLFTAAWDFSRLSSPYRAFEQDPSLMPIEDRSYENWKAYEVLKQLDQKLGPGLAFTDFPAGTQDETLGFASYPFNQAWNEEIQENQLQWAALFVSSSYQPFLSARFPRMRWVALDSGPHPAWVIGVLPWNDPEAQTFLLWKPAHHFFVELNNEIHETANGVPREKILNTLLQSYSSLSADPFLQSCLWEKVIFTESWESTFYPPPPAAQKAVYAEAFHQWGLKGYPTSLFWYKKGLWLFSLGQKQEAEKCEAKAESLNASLADPL